MARNLECEVCDRTVEIWRSLFLSHAKAQKKKRALFIQYVL
ncbi:MAG: hypothetical protein RM368_30410 [Nostoc sp. DedSLP03]|nr:hypothetical protein [Nostoc sp. DedSLP03]MDZ7969212.1 hypothetical protein [Nostoc sp. DedSLP03]